MPESIHLKSFKTEDLNVSLQHAIVQLCIEAHQEEDFKNLFAYVPAGGWHFLAYRDQQPVSHAMVTTRWLQPAGQPLLKTAYVDAVSTLREYQRQGYGSAVMRRLAGEIDPDFSIACLETGRIPFYERLGWESWRGPLAGRSEQGLIPTVNDGGVMILRLSQTPALDLDDLLTIECQTGRIW